MAERVPTGSPAPVHWCSSTQGRPLGPTAPSPEQAVIAGLAVRDASQTGAVHSNPDLLVTGGLVACCIS